MVRACLGCSWASVACGWGERQGADADKGGQLRADAGRCLGDEREARRADRCRAGHDDLTAKDVKDAKDAEVDILRGSLHPAFTRAS